MNSPTKKPKEFYICFDEEDMDGRSNILMTDDKSHTKNYKYSITIFDYRNENPDPKEIGQIILE